ncbi:P12 [Pseudomonas phage phi8]|uniref:p12 n=1 Tax=Pseudomonas phage phi8 TaxID=120086 RepID=Q9MC05_9VIRU|nr:hypothetical protein phi-8Sp2 [Pseudomonas phage phi8]AAF63310.1 P12 [Pseudomonas phage phi8]
MLKMLLATQGLTTASIMEILTGFVVRRVRLEAQPLVASMMPSVREEVARALNDKAYRQVLAGAGQVTLRVFNGVGQLETPLVEIIKDIARLSSPTFKSMLEKAERGENLGSMTDELAESIVAELVALISADATDVTTALSVPGADVERYRLIVDWLRGHIKSIEQKDLFPDIIDFLE